MTVSSLSREQISVPHLQKIRPRVQGKFIFIGEKKLYLRGVTYGTLKPNENGSEYGSPEIVEHDFARMAANNVNAVRTYTVPPRWLLDSAQRHGLWVMVGLAWEQHIAFLSDKSRIRSIEDRIRAGVRACAGHPAVLCYAIGNEIPAPIVRWHGQHRIGRFLKQIYKAAKAEDPEALVTYVNYPSTEYLHLPFVDFVCFNVYLETKEKLEPYLARLQNIAGDRPLLIAEIGLDSRQNGENIQEKTLEWQIRTTFAAGCAGTFVFAWTDEWSRGGHEIHDWDFGVTRRDRTPKPALTAIRKAYAEIPFSSGLRWPSISVVVCTYNGSLTIRSCLEGLRNLQYPDFEVIVVDDGSMDQTAAIAHEFDFRVISTENRGLSSARNTGLEAARGEIIAYIDDDAYPDPDWLSYLAHTFLSTKHVGVGGPNISPPGDGPIAQCVANAPGGPVHVLLSDQEAEHIPGCNMAFRKEQLLASGGFDRQFRVAGDDVDICWSMQQRGWTLGFSPAAMVWHHRRNSVRSYWKQQKGYGKAEALLERKWPEKYNAAGHLIWTGRLYGKGLIYRLGWRPERIYQGNWGSALFQSVYQPAHGFLSSLPLMPEWYLVIIVIATFSIVGSFWRLLPFDLILLATAVGASLIQASLGAARSSLANPAQTGMRKLKSFGLTTFLYLLQPLARLNARLHFGLTPWRYSGANGSALPWPRTYAIWSEKWQAHHKRFQSIETALRTCRANVLRGGDYDRWDLEVQGGILGATRIRMAIEEHGGGRQLLRLRLWPKCSTKLLLPILLLVITPAGLLQHNWIASTILSLGAMLVTLRTVRECASSTASVLEALDTMVRVNADELTSAADIRQLQPNTEKVKNNGRSHGEFELDVTTRADKRVTTGFYSTPLQPSLKSKSANG